MKKIVITITASLLILIMTGCAAMTVTSNHFTGVTSEKRGEATNTVWLSLFGTQYPTAEEVAKAAGITKIASVERYATPGILYLYVDYTTIVTGE